MAMDEADTSNYTRRPMTLASSNTFCGQTKARQRSLRKQILGRKLTPMRRRVEERKSRHRQSAGQLESRPT